MIPRKLVERGARKLPLLLLPVIVVPALVVAAIVVLPSVYQSSATIWVSEATGLNAISLGDENQFSAPAARQARVLADLLLTESFREDVAAEAGLIQLGEGDVSVSPERVRLAAARAVSQAVTIQATGFNILTISAESRDPALAQRLVAALVNQYQARVSNEGERQTSIAIAYFNEQLGVAQKELSTRENALASYVSLNPEVTDAKTFDLEYRSLLAEVDAQNTVVSDLLNSLQNWYLSAAATSQGLAARFNLLDQPSMPRDPLPLTRTQRFGYPVAGLMLGGFVSAVYLYVVYRTDHTILSSEDVQEIGVPLLGYVPAVSSKHNQRWYRRLGRAERNFARRLAASIGLRAPGEGAA